MDALDDEGAPLHVLRFGSQLDVQGVLAGSKDATEKLHRYLSKYLTKSLGGAFLGEDASARQHAHAARMAEALRYEPCSPTCANWLRYGVQPKNARAGLVPGRCRGKAHKPDHLGYAGRRVLVSRKWSNKTLAEHKQDRRTWVLEVLGVPAASAEPGRYLWRPALPGDPDVPTLDRRLMRGIRERQRWRASLMQLHNAAGSPELSATEQPGAIPSQSAAAGGAPEGPPEGARCRSRNGGTHQAAPRDTSFRQSPQERWQHEK